MSKESGAGFNALGARVQASKDFDGLLACLKRELLTDANYKQRLAELMREWSDEVLGKIEPSTLLTMGVSEACRFENEKIEFGAYVGSTYKDVPIGYLDFIADKSVRLQSYLRSTEAEKRRNKNK